MGNILLLD